MERSNLQKLSYIVTLVLINIRIYTKVKARLFCPIRKNLFNAKESTIGTFDLNEILNSFIDVVKMDIEGSELDLLPLFYRKQNLIGALYADLGRY